MFIVDIFWSENVWLPPNVTWDDIAPGPDKPVYYNNHYHIWFSLPLALMFIGLQTAFERVMSRWLGLRDRSYHKAAHRPKWRPSMRSPGTWNRIKGVIDRWRDSHYYAPRPSPLDEFCQSVWNCIFYISIFIFGTNVLRNKEWLWDLDQCYVGYPHHRITNDVWWYYVISLAFYWSFIYRILMSALIWYEYKLNDFWFTLVHHMTFITLLYLSWVCNLHRIGTLVLLCHNVSDVFLQSFKAAQSAHHRLNFCDILLPMLIISWISTRIIVFPYYIIWSTMFRAPNLMAMFPAYYIFNSLLCLLFALHIQWGLQNHILNEFYDIIELYVRKWRKQSFNRKVLKKKESTSDRDTTKDDNKMTWDKLYLLTDVNDYVDMAISQLVPLMKKSGLDPLDLTDAIGGFDERNPGHMTGLANVERFGDQRIRFMDNKLSIRLQFQFTKLKLLYTYMSLITKNIEGSLDHFRIAFDLVVDFDNEKPLSLQEFSITDMSEIRVQRTGNFLVLENQVNNLTIRMCLNIFHKAIVDVVNSKIADAIQDGLDFVNANIKNVMQSIMLYPLFQDKKVSNLIIDRYAQWKKNKKTSESQTDVKKTNELKKNEQSFMNKPLCLIL